MNSIPKRGPCKIKLCNGNYLDLWYNSEIRFWTLQELDAVGNQIGPNRRYADGPSEASYHHHRQWAVDEMNEIIARENAKADAILEKLMADETLDADGLKGDAPGAAPVKIEVDGRTLVMPRALMTTIVTFAYNRACDKADNELDDLGHAWLVNFTGDIHKLGKFVKSR